VEPLIIVLAFGAGLLFREFGFPPLLGYLLAGFAQPLAEAGILLLLFTVGLKLKPADLQPRYVWGSALAHMVIAVPLTALVIVVVGQLYGPLAFEHAAAPWLLAFALSFSSTVLAIKLFDDRGEGSSFYARNAIGVLVVQDVLAVIFLVFSADYLTR